MTSPRAVAYGAGAALLVAYLATANMPSGPPPSRERAAPTAGTTGTESLAVEVQSQAARLHALMAQAPVPDPNPRNPFSFRQPRTSGGAPAAAVAPPAAEAAPVVVEAPLPVLTLMGIAEEAASGGVRRTAVIGGDGDTIYMVTEGQPVGARYRVTRIGADAVELEDVVTKGYRRIAMR